MANPAYDMVEPIIGSFRARLAAALTPDASGGVGPIGVSLDTNGRVVKGTAGQSGLVGILVKNAARGPVGRWDTSLHGVPNPNAPIGLRAGDTVDIMANGSIANLDPTDFPAGSPVYCDAAGDLSTTSAAGSFLIGFTQDAGYLFVRFSYGAAAVA